MVEILDLREDYADNDKLNRIDYEMFTFKGGEPHIKIKKIFFYDVTSITIFTRLTSFNKVGELLVAVDALKRLLKESNYTPTLNLVIDYFPGARQDRVMVQGEALTVKVYADLINSLEMNSVFIMDPHSDVTPALINNCRTENNHYFIKQVLKSCATKTNGSDTPYIISPDAGSNKKIGALAKELSKTNKIEVIKCDKTRDVRTGEITDFVVYAGDLKGKNCLIVDDICDGGGTFIGLANELMKKNAGKLYLAVSHGIFSQGFKNLQDYFECIYTTDSFNDYGDTWAEAHRHHKGFTAPLIQIKI